MAHCYNPYFRKNLKKFTESQGDLAKTFRDGVEAAFCETMTTGDDAHWTELEYRKDGNGNMAWYVDLYSCSQENFLQMAKDDEYIERLSIEAGLSNE